MVTTRSMLARVRQLEIKKANPALGLMGGEVGWSAVQADVEAGLADGRYDCRDMRVVMRCLTRWVGAQ